eukprot:275683_1
MALNEVRLPYAEFESPDSPVGSVGGNLNVESQHPSLDLHRYHTASLQRFKWCTIHWHCCCCNCKLYICLIAFLLFSSCTLTFLLTISYLGGYIFQTAPHKPACCTQNCKTFDYTAWDNVLTTIVKPATFMHGIYSTLIDYKALNANATLNAIFDGLIHDIVSVEVDALDCASQYAFYTNVYNIFTIKMIMEHKDKGHFVTSIIDITQYFGLRSAWKMTAGQIGGTDYTLNNIKHDVLNHYWNDSRLYSCLHCAALSCPDLINTHYKPDTMEAQLLYSFRRWTNNTSKGMRIDGDTLYLSMLFGWYHSHFKPTMRSFIMQYTASDVMKEEIESTTRTQYMDFNWNLNIFNV